MGEGTGQKGRRKGVCALPYEEKKRKVSAYDTANIAN